MFFNVSSACQIKEFRYKNHIISSISFLSLSALSVRFLTKRYIGEYDHQTGKLGKTFSNGLSAKIGRCIKMLYNVADAFLFIFFFNIHA